MKPVGDGIGRKTLQVAVGLVFLLIIYGSLYPFRWNLAAPQAFVWRGPVGLMDLVENIVLFLPLGFLLGWDWQQHPHRRTHFAGWLLLSMGVAGGLQWLQKYLPRTPALSDVVFNLLGYLLGWGAGWLARWRMGHLLERHRHWAQADRFTLVLLALWLVAELYPLIPTLAVSEVWHNVKSLWQTPAWQPRRMLLHVGMTVLGLAAVAQLLRSVQLAHHARLAAGAMAAAVLLGKFGVMGQRPGVAVVAGIAGGWLLWRLLDTLPERLRWASTAWVAVLTYALDAFWPWQWRAVPSPMVWVPFSASLATMLQSAIAARALECLCFGAIVWSTVRNGGLLIGLTLCTALLAFVGEWAQRYLPTRTPEITSVVLALAMGWLVHVCTAARPARKVARMDRPPLPRLARD